MIKDNICIGSMESSMHTFNIATNGINVFISKGEYYRNNEILFTSDIETIVEIPITDKEMEYALMLTTNGLVVVQQEVGKFQIIEVKNLIDKLVWFILPPNCDSLDYIDVNVLKIVEEVQQ